MPLYIESGARKIKRHHINLNNYRNWHHQVSNNIKIKYSDIVANKLLRYKNKNFPKIKLEFTYYKPTKAKRDRSNILSIHEKFFCDALTKIGFIADDNDDIIKSSFFSSGGLDRENPRAEIKITIL